MSSVEELCDNIALINRSRKILEGNVMEIRKKHRTETYEVEISGLNGMDLCLAAIMHDPGKY